MEIETQNLVLILDAQWPLYVLASSIETNSVRIGSTVLATTEVVTFMIIPLIEQIIVVDARVAQTEYRL